MVSSTLENVFTDTFIGRTMGAAPALCCTMSATFASNFVVHEDISIKGRKPPGGHPGIYSGPHGLKIVHGCTQTRAQTKQPRAGEGKTMYLADWRNQEGHPSIPHQSAMCPQDNTMENIYAPVPTD